ncbi:HU family DNA-binding protein [Fusobacterium sp. THCT1E2]
MKEIDFIRLYSKKNKTKNLKISKQKIRLIWESIYEAIDIDGSLTLLNMGMFEKKELKPRKIYIPVNGKISVSKPKSVIKFKAGKGWIKLINESSDSYE